jgi:hypothetical protein
MAVINCPLISVPALVLAADKLLKTDIILSNETLSLFFKSYHKLFN